MNYDVSSHGQQGGITAEHVTVHGDLIQKQSGSPPELQPPWWRRLSRVAVLVTILTGILSLRLCAGSGNKEGLMSDEQDQPVRITSINQMGGITAYNVNVGVADRKLTTETAQQLLDKINSTGIDNIRIETAMGDQEAMQFGEIIRDFLTDAGFTVQEFLQAVWERPIIGQQASAASDGKRFLIRIGSKPDSMAF